MNIKKVNMWESFLYCFLCIASLGTLFVTRIMITKAIKQALEEME